MSRALQEHPGGEAAFSNQNGTSRQLPGLWRQEASRFLPTRRAEGVKAGKSTHALGRESPYMQRLWLPGEAAHSEPAQRDMRTWKPSEKQGHEAPRPHSVEVSRDPTRSPAPNEAWGKSQPVVPCASNPVYWYLDRLHRMEAWLGHSGPVCM